MGWIIWIPPDVVDLVTVLYYVSGENVIGTPIVNGDGLPGGGTELIT